ncbi:MAG TPA: pseudouridine-5'-phosphate glycosidase [Gemmatimonadaceae bacterium]|nr:pseudouridine-5'-phosphate glycosidase [Gemmatimonadaceae bacterium]
MGRELTVSTAVADALRSNLPVVALESTLITHGLPWPHNMETALAMEHAVRAAGAVPATIAVLGGDITVGISAADIERLASRPFASVRKCSRRDLPIAVARREDASTTVAGTMIVAHQAGIRVFGTGGIGGVHRGAPFDVSADLIELGRTPVAVVCAGAKSILDLPATLEVLETQGVPIVGLGTDTLPGFYARSTGLPIDVRVETPEEAAAIVDAAHRLDAQHAVLIVVPVPEEAAFPAADAEAAIQQATREAEAQGIHGKAVTPFLLQRVSELTGGGTRAANTALLVNSARHAGLIARALAGSPRPEA